MHFPKHSANPFWQFQSFGQLHNATGSRPFADRPTLRNYFGHEATGATREAQAETVGKTLRREERVIELDVVLLPKAE